MKKATLLAAAAALLMASPAVAQAGGSAGLSYTSTDAGAGGDGDTYQLDGAFGGANGSLGYQIDAGLGSIDDNANSQTIAGHVYWNGGGWRLGGVVAYTNIEPDSASSVSETAYGVEGTWDLATNAVLFGSYTVGETEFSGPDFDTWNADIGLNYYFSDNFRVGGAYGAGNLDAGVIDADVSIYRINGEWQPWSTPVSFTLGWNSLDLDGAPDNFDSWTVGVRYNWGGSLRERDNATPFDTRSPLLQRMFDLR